MSTPRLPEIPPPVPALGPDTADAVLPGDALAGVDGTQEPPPPPPFVDPVGGLLTGELPVAPAGTPLAPPPIAPIELDAEAIARAARELEAAPVRRRRAPRSSGRPAAPQPTRPAAIATAGKPPERQRRSVGTWLIALLVLLVVGFNLIRELVDYLIRILH